VRFKYRLQELAMKKLLLNSVLPWHVIFDVDGVLTDGTFTYSANGKIYKVFGSHDSDALNILKDFCEISFVSADKRGFEISKKRVLDMGFDLQLADASDRLKLIRNLQSKSRIIFVADSFTDVSALQCADISAVPRNAHSQAKKVANIVLKANGGQGAVSEVSFLIMNTLRKKDIQNEQ